MMLDNYILLPILSVLLILILESHLSNAQSRSLNSVYSWSSLDFDFPSQSDRDEAIASGNFIPGRPVPIDVDVYFRNKEGKIRTFVTVPRFQDGVPLTIGYVTSKKNDKGNHLIAPYPNWRMQRSGGDCTGITSVYRVAIDDCDRLWIMDTGKLADRQVCPPQLHVYSLTTDRWIRSYPFPKELYRDSSLYITPIVDRRDSCENVFVYIADVTGFGLIVYDYARSRSWKINNNLFYPYPTYGTFEINEESFDLMDGLFGLALGPVQTDGDRMLYFHSLASRVEAYVPTSVIRNFSLFENNPDAAPRQFKPFLHERSSQAGPQAMDRDGVLFFGLMSDTAIACWNSKNYQEFPGKNSEKVVVDRETLQFASGLKIVSPKGSNKQQLWVITVSFQKFMTGSMDPTQTNFRIQAAEVEDLVRNTKCQVTDNDGSKIFFIDQ